MFGRFKQFYRKHSRAFAGGITLLVIVAWLLGPALLDMLSLGQSFLLSFAILAVLLASIQEYLDEIARPTSLSVVAGQNENNFAIVDALSGVSVTSVRMIEYDSESTKALIFFFLAKGAHVHCLLQHPDAAINESQRRRTIFQIVTLDEEYSGYLDQIRFDYYKDQASLRGRLIDDKLVSLGWYTYDRRDGGTGRQIWGHNNPVLLSPGEGEQNRVLRRFFGQTFEGLLANSDTWESLASQYDLYIRRRSGVSAGGSVRMTLELATLARTSPPASPPGVVLAGCPLGEVPANFAIECLPVLSSAFDDRHWNEQAVNDAVLAPATCRWVATARTVEGGKLVGIATVHSLPDPNQAKLHWVGVDTGWRGSGVGRALVVMACQKAIELNARTMILHTEAFRVPAISLYESLGFRTVEPVDELAVPGPRSTRSG